MATNIRLKSSSISNKVPTLSDLSLRELAVNTTDGRLFLRKGNGTVSDVIVDVTDHGSFYGLADDDHTQYLHSTITRTGVTAELNTTGKITTTNSIGIGTTTPVKKLQIGSLTGNFSYTSTDALGIASSQNPGISVRNTTNTSEFDLEVSSDTNGMRMGSSTSHNFSLMTSNELRVTITASGNVGIGTTNPGTALDVIGDIRSSTALRTIKGQLADEGGGVLLQTTGYLRISNGNSEFIRLSSAGNLGIGTTNPIEKLDIRGNIYFPPNNYISPGFVNNTERFILKGYANDYNISAIAWVPAISYTASFDTANRGYKIGAFNNDGQYQNWVSIWDGSVGIGTTSPLAKLHIQGTASEIWLRDSGTKTLALQTSNNIQYIKAIDVGVGGLPLEFYASRYNFSTGNVGIGITNPTYKLDVDGVARASIFVSTSYSVFSSIVVNEPGVNYYSWNNRIGGGLAVVGTTFFDGNVGIGTTNPTSKLHIIGDQYVVGNITNNAGNYFTDGTSGYFWNGAGSYSAGIFGGASGLTTLRSVGNIVVETGGTGEKLRIDTNGNVGIGTTNPGYKLDVHAVGGSTATTRLYGNDQANVRLRLENVGSGGRTWELIGGLSGANNSNFSIFDVTSTATRLTIDSSGNVAIGVTSTSDKLCVVSSSNYTIRTGSTTIINPNNSGSEIIGAQISVGGNIILSERQPNTAFSDRTDLAIVTNTGYGLGQSEKIRIKAEGNVGIGTTDPNSVLDVNGTQYIVRNALYNSESNAGLYIRGSRSLGSVGLILGADNTTGIAYIQPLQTGTTYAQNMSICAMGGNVGIGTTNPQAKLDVNGNVLPTTDATHNLGSPTKRWNNVYTTDLQLSNEGSHNDVDGTWGAYTIQEGEGDLFLINRRNGKKYKFVLQEVN